MQSKVIEQVQELKFKTSSNWHINSNFVRKQKSKKIQEMWGAKEGRNDSVVAYPEIIRGRAKALFSPSSHTTAICMIIYTINSKFVTNMDLG